MSGIDISRFAGEQRRLQREWWNVYCKEDNESLARALETVLLVAERARATHPEHTCVRLLDRIADELHAAILAHRILNGYL